MDNNPVKQEALFSEYAGMSLLDMWKECGKVRRKFYGKQMAYEIQKAKENESSSPVNTQLLILDHAGDGVDCSAGHPDHNAHD